MIPTHLKVGATLPKLRNYPSSRHREPSPPPPARSNLTNDKLPPISKLPSPLVDHPETYFLDLDLHLLSWWSVGTYVLDPWWPKNQPTFRILSTLPISEIPKHQLPKFPQHRPFQKSHNINFQIFSTPTQRHFSQVLTIQERPFTYTKVTD